MFGNVITYNIYVCCADVESEIRIVIEEIKRYQQAINKIEIVLERIWEKKIEQNENEMKVVVDMIKNPLYKRKN